MLDVFITFCQGWRAVPALSGASEEQQKQTMCLWPLSSEIKIPEETLVTAEQSAALVR